MSANISQIGTAIENLNLNFTNINTTNILQTAIEYNNANSDGWMGIIIFIIMCGTIAIYLWKNKNEFNLFDMLNLNLANLIIFLDIGIYLVIWKIIESYSLFIWFYTFYFTLCAISLLRKDLQNTES